MPTKKPTPYTEKFQNSQSWTDDLPVCKYSGVGYSTNQIYRQDGQRQEEHPFEDTTFQRASHDTSTSLYGVFDGHDGNCAAVFAVQRLAAEILLGQLTEKRNDDEIREVLRLAFLAVEESYKESMGAKLAERIICQSEIPPGMTFYALMKDYPQLAEKLNSINEELSCGTTAVIALISGKKLFVANVGNCRALLCRTDENNVLRVIQVGVDHDLRNDDELLRFYNLGLKITKGHSMKLANQDYTRCLGNFLAKDGYKDFEELRCASVEPIIAEPEIHGSIELDESCRFLLLMSDGLYKSLESCGTDPDNVNKEIAQMVVTEFRVQSTLTGVAQAVVDKVARRHHDLYMSGNRTDLTSRDDITLLVRNFNHPMPSVSSSNNTPIVGSSVYSTTSTENQSEMSPARSNIPAYVDFSEFYTNVSAAMADGTLPEALYPYFNQNSNPTSSIRQEH